MSSHFDPILQHTTSRLELDLENAIQELIQTIRSVRPIDERNMREWIKTIRSYNEEFQDYLPEKN